MPAREDTTSAAGGDGELLAFLTSVELTLARVYAAGAPLIRSATATAVAAAFAEHHRAHAEALAQLTALYGSTPPTRPNQALLANLSPSMEAATTETAELGLLLAVERQIAGTHQYALARLGGADAQKHVGSILPVEAEHVVVIGTLLSRPLEDLVPAFQDDAGFPPSDFPVAPRT